MKLFVYALLLMFMYVSEIYSGTGMMVDPSAPPLSEDASTSTSMYPDIGQRTRFVPGTAITTVTEVELSVSAKDLIQADYLSKSDPFCVVYEYPPDAAQWLELHRTETIWNNHDPEFAKKIIMLYKFEEIQPLRFEFYDRDSDSWDLKDHDFLGYAECKLSDIITTSTCKLEKRLMMMQNGVETVLKSKIIVKAEELLANKEQVVMKFSAENLDKKSWLGYGHSYPFIEIYKATELNDYVLVYRSEVIRRDSNPRWKQFTLHMKTLCNGDRKRSLKIVCRHASWGGTSSIIGELYTSVEEIDAKKREFDLQLLQPEREHKLKYRNSGKLYVEHFVIERFHSFMDYLRGGLQIHCTVAIDFTASNGHPQTRDSLHYIGTSSTSNLRPMNDYEQAITSVVSIIEDYDSDKLFPALGFGAVVSTPNGYRTSHDFYVSMNSENVFCAGTEGVLRAYRSCLSQIQLSGPTNFEPVIHHVAEMARMHETNGENYFILLILTDGQIMDMHQTIETIVEASSLPVSIIIVGVGNADFSSMDILDADREPLRTANGRVARRDIVQFVPFNEEFSRNLSPNLARARLAKKVLAEVPWQVVSYMRSHNLEPKSPRADPQSLPPDPEIL